MTNSISYKYSAQETKKVLTFEFISHGVKSLEKVEIIVYPGGSIKLVRVEENSVSRVLTNADGIGEALAKRLNEIAARLEKQHVAYAESMQAVSNLETLHRVNNIACGNTVVHLHSVHG